MRKNRIGHKVVDYEKPNHLVGRRALNIERQHLLHVFLCVNKMMMNEA
jgi:hypothetical protein